ncbi:hypothetical protein B0T14DRAFT_523750 [Immersiella caudata]|uniref:Uncharacterized protein n=1 Tax=Immersiella caudata TaxID=314043 RepID=A0AA39WJX9_9PEZI|nr:hypothetical protein B0T14DRAFT_523750 [Immersiella caudata]
MSTQVDRNGLTHCYSKAVVSFERSAKRYRSQQRQHGRDASLVTVRFLTLYQGFCSP